jgi:nitrogen fixation protein NifQ
MNGPDRLPYRSLLLAELLARPATAAIAADPNRPLLASLIAGQVFAEGCLPAHLGLGVARHAQMLADYFPGAPPRASERNTPDIPEFADLQKLLLDHRAGVRDCEYWIADIVATACAGSDHLWQDLGLSSRAELTRLLWVNFPELAKENSSDMKWKKFLYRRFCASEGIYVCPAPSCSQCRDYARCFGPEG